MLFISHDLAVMEYLSDRIAVIYLGRVMEIGPSRQVVASPRHPYTEALISAVPDDTGNRKRIILQGDAPSPIAPPSGCVFRTRCRYALPACADEVPTLREVAPGHWKACHATTCRRGVSRRVRAGMMRPEVAAAMACPTRQRPERAVSWT